MQSPGTAEPIRLVLVDDHQMVLDGLRAMLRPHSDRLVVVGATTDPHEALRLLHAEEPAVVLVDVRMRSVNGLDLCRQFLDAVPGIRVVVLTVYDDEQYLFQALRAGASGYLTKQVTAEELLDHLDRVRGGEIVIDPSLAGRVALSAARLQRGSSGPARTSG
jgi:Response regulator containing a CheY-like receiver domain and an HTH DNA-binding domain